MQYLKTGIAGMLAASALFIGGATGANPSNKKLSIQAPLPLDTTAATQATTAFRKMESKVSVGISYARYEAELPDLDFAVNEFADSDFAKKVPTAVIAYQQAERTYRNAAMVWNAFDRMEPYIMDMRESDMQRFVEYCPLNEITLKKTAFRAKEPCLTEMWERAIELAATGKKIIADSKAGKPKTKD